MKKQFSFIFGLTLAVVSVVGGSVAFADCTLSSLPCDYEGNGEWSNLYHEFPRCTVVYMNGQEVTRDQDANEAINLLARLKQTGLCN